MTAQQLDIFDALPSAPIEGETAAVVASVASDWRSDDDWRRFRFACVTVAVSSDNAVTVDPNLVRAELSNDHGLTIQPRRYSAFWHRAAGKSGFLTAVGWTTNTDHAGKNAGKPTRLYEMRPTT